MLRRGDKTAFDHLYDLYFDSLFGFGRQYRLDDEIVQDCIQDLFVHLWLNREKLPEVASVKAYLYRSFKNRILNILRKEKMIREKTTFAWDSDDGSAVAFPHEAFLISGEEDSEKKESLRHAFRDLTDHQREALYLRFYENMEYDEIAETLSLKDVKYARTLIYRSLETLKNGLMKLPLFKSIEIVNLIALAIAYTKPLG